MILTLFVLQAVALGSLALIGMWAAHVSNREVIQLQTAARHHAERDAELTATLLKLNRQLSQHVQHANGASPLQVRRWFDLTQEGIQ